MKLVRLLIWKEFLHIKKDKMSVRLMIFPVFIQILIMGYALTTEVKNTSVTMLDLSNTASSRSLIESVRNNELFVFKGMTSDYDNIRERIDRGEVKIGIVVPEDFDRRLRSSDGAVVQLLIDGQDANSANVANGYINAIIGKWGTAFLQNEAKSNGHNLSTMIPVKVNPVILFNPLLKSTWYMVPALVVLLVTMVTSLLSGLSIVREKEKGTLEQLMVTPVEPIHIIIGKTFPYLVIGFVELFIFLIFATLWFQIPFRGSLTVFLFFGFLYMLSSLGIGILTSTVARTPQQVLFLVWFILIFFILLSGFFIPVENMPEWVQKTTYINPMRFFMYALRSIFLKGSQITELLREIYALGLTGIVVFGASVLFFHRRAK